MKKLEILIAGGGTAGWMTAAALGKLMQHSVNVRLVESDQIGTVGVGEATIPTMRSFHFLLGIDEQEFMRETFATFKLGINFEGWKSQQSAYFHSFGTAGKDSWAGEFQHFWMRAKKQGVAGDFSEYSIELKAALAERFSSVTKPRLNYAYHLDATAYAKYLRKFAEQFGVERIEGKISSVPLRPESGDIQSVVLESGQVLEADLFIDCTGFRGLLIEETLHTGYEDWSHWLPSDSAVAVQTKSVSSPKPYTRSIAHPFGWQWQIPLQHRMGNGLVYCSRYCTDEQARSALLENVQGELISDPRLIRFKTGKRRKSWNKNCISIGLSSGFLEPLESTSIHLISSAIIRLMKLLPVNGDTQLEAEEFNRQTEVELREVRDFIILHYFVNNRSGEKFWDLCRRLDVPDSLRQRIELYKQSARIFWGADELFTVNSWNQVMLGQGIMPESYHPIADVMSDKDLNEYFRKMKGYVSHVVDALPAHEAFLKSHCASPLAN